MTCNPGGVKTRTRTCARKCDNVISDDLTQTTSCNDHDCPLSVWHGERSIATYETDSGEWSNEYSLVNMFDDESTVETIWHSSQTKQNTVQTLTFKFFNAIVFQYLKLRKWTYSPAANAYLNVCLVLDDDIANQLCTDQPKGFSDSDGDGIQWTLPKNNVRKVELVFRDVESTGYPNDLSGQAMVRDLKIFFARTLQGDNYFTGQCLKTHGSPNRALNQWRIQQVNDLTIEKCLEACKFEKYAGLGAGQNCFCDDKLNSIDVLADSACNMKCTGDQSQNCGGDMKLNVYSIDSPQPFTGQCLQDYASGDRIIGDVFRVFPSTITIEKCLEFCKNYKLAAVRDLHCFCANEFAREAQILPDSDCHLQCEGDTSQSCGGTTKNNVYTIVSPQSFTSNIFLSIPDEKAITFSRNPVAEALTVPKHFRLTFEEEIIHLNQLMLSNV